MPAPAPVPVRDLASQVIAILEKTKLPLDCVEPEIAESVIMQEIDSSIRIMASLAELAVRFSVDGFGTGIWDIVGDPGDVVIIAMPDKLGL